MADDLELKELDNFTGTEAYHKIGGMIRSQATDGVGYVMENGYSWFVTDMLVIIEMKLKDKDDFYAVKLKVKGSTAVATIEDGNGKVYHKQNYNYTSAKKDLTLYWRDGIIMLSREY